MTDQSQIVIYEAGDGQTRIEVRFEQDTIWLSQAQMAELFDKDSDTIGLHLKNIYQSGELDENSTTEESSVVRQEGKRQVKRNIKLYNLDAVISVGYRVNSKKGTQFRIWATQRLRDYLVQGYSINQDRCKIAAHRGRSAMNKLLLPPGEGGDEGKRKFFLTDILRAPSERKTAGVDPQRVTFVSPKVTKSIAAGFQRSHYFPVIEYPRHE